MVLQSTAVPSLGQALVNRKLGSAEQVIGHAPIVLWGELRAINCVNLGKARRQGSVVYSSASYGKNRSFAFSIRFSEPFTSFNQPIVSPVSGRNLRARRTVARNWRDLASY
ncbi:hypothetical protein [Bradyrhizobium sp.]|uniref:hypothetical protein n=1 Tax=Bradyrhizobium sp. TaxID=376 RepID=UPI001D819075|nr:hypothetical protein [Bradyrhizobium sp.]MBV8700498.1 hypothetical protein [Bradyrhizobium sp.]MBV8923672.1 hypothetical protein [Bradyrhizobium sp.]MBV9981791.1 hypothetical protein [Bradyrhizobium sp.]